MRVFLVLIFLVSAVWMHAQSTPCFESVVVPVQYETVTFADPDYRPVPPKKVILPKRYRFDTTYVEQVPTGRPQPSHIPKQYKLEISRVAIPCEGKIDDQGNCYIMQDSPKSRKAITEERPVPCAYEQAENGDCIKKVEILCPESIKCKTRKSIQQALLAAGYQPGKGKKAFSTTTLKALQLFQTDNKLHKAGITMESLKLLLK